MISVLMPVYNAATTLRAALDSLARQTTADWELVAVDDGSTDGSGAILHAYAGRDRRIRIVTTPHGGIVAALNTALGAARGELIARMDADDACLPIAWTGNAVISRSTRPSVWSPRACASGATGWRAAATRVTSNGRTSR